MKISRGIQLFIQYSCLFIVVLESRPIIKLPSGRIKGILLKSMNDRPIYTYMSIPYAKPPIGQLRFKEPEEADPWTGTLDAGQLPPTCVQKFFGSNELTGVEDCLHINVYTPIRPAKIRNNVSERLLPVIAYIHGGGFYFFNSARYGPKYLLDHDILLVTFNYRLGTLGFLSSGDDVVPGNLGMKDQILALKWIQNNIHYFGGDAKLVTLMGMSAGSSSAHLHYTSPLSKGLFSGSIMLGGSAFTTWGFQAQPMRKFKRFAENVGCYSNISESSINCLRNISVDKIASSISLFQSKIFSGAPTSPLAPVVEARSKNAFLYDDPFQSFMKGNVHRVPAIFTFADNEGILPVGGIVANPALMDQVNKYWITFCVDILELREKVNPKILGETCHKIRKFYCDFRPITLANIRCLMKMMSDRNMSDLIRAVAATARTNARVYAYKFSYQGSYSSSLFLSGSNNDYGPCHTDDLYYYVNTTSSAPLLESQAEDVQMIKMMTAMIAKFALTRKAEWPNQDWRPVDKVKTSDLFKGKINYLRIISPSISTVVQETNVGNSSFWNSLPICQPWAGRFPNTNSPSTLSNCLNLLY